KADSVSKLNKQTLSPADAVEERDTGAPLSHPKDESTRISEPEPQPEPHVSAKSTASADDKENRETKTTTKVSYLLPASESDTLIRYFYKTNVTRKVSRRMRQKARGQLSELLRDGYTIDDVAAVIVFLAKNSGRDLFGNEVKMFGMVAHLIA